MPAWILVADASRGRIFSCRGPEEPWECIESPVHAESRMKTGELTTGAAGEMGQRAGYGRPAMDPSTDPHEVAAQKFARELTTTLERGFDQRRFDQLILVAPPAFLGLLRQGLPPKLEKVVITSVDKDLTLLPDQEVSHKLKDLIPRFG